MSKILHFELDSIVNGQALDQSGNGYNGTVQGGVTVVNDATFDSCLEFNGTDGHIVLDDTLITSILVQNSFTVTAWVYLDSTSGDNSILGTLSGNGPNTLLHLVIRDGHPYLGFLANDTQHTAVLNTGQWYHISWVYDYDATNGNGSQIMYINGADPVTAANRDPLQSTSGLHIGSWHSQHFFDGKLYGFRIYDTALSQSEIQSIMVENQASLQFRSTYPIDFDLYDKDTQNVLYIEDTSDQTLTLQLKNASVQTIQLDDLTANTVSSSNYHFALRFRPGTLSSATLTGIALATGTAANWEMTLLSDAATGMDVAYLKSTSASLSMDPDTLQTLVFEKVGADAAQGPRGSRVELLYTNMGYSGNTETLSGKREIHLSVINHRGKQNIPLHIGFVGDNGVLNDGATPNALKLRFSNTLVHDVTNPDIAALTFLHHADATLRSRFILSFDAGTVAQEEWALGTETEIRNIIISQPVGWTITEPVQGESPEWILYPDTQNQVLYGINDPDTNHPGHFDLDITNIVSAFPTGHTQLHIQYENIPGYWDGQMKLTLEKRPLVYDTGNVGIGTTIPSAKLDVVGNLAVDGNVSIGNTTPSAPLSIGTTAGKESDPDAAMHITNDCILFGGNNNGKQEVSAQISAGKHVSNSLNIVGMSSGTSYIDRKVDMWAEGGFTVRGYANVNATAAPLSIMGNGKESSPDASMHITNDCILFGGNNNGKENNSAQISAGKHHANSLNIVGMSSGTGSSDRKVDIWAEGDLNIMGRTVVNGNLRISEDADSYAELRFEQYSNRNGFKIYLEGGNHNVGGSTVHWDGDSNWDFSSDQRLKTNIDNEKDILRRLLQLDVKNYNWKHSPDRKLKSIGFIAQDVAPLFPALVGETMEEEGKEPTLTLKYGAFGVLAVGALKELKEETDAIIARQNKRIAKQDKLIKELLNRIAALEEKLG